MNTKTELRKRNIIISIRGGKTVRQVSASCTAIFQTRRETE
jgi:hypothetical protein